MKNEELEKYCIEVTKKVDCKNSKLVYNLDETGYYANIYNRKEISYTIINDNEQSHTITKRVWYRISLLVCVNYSGDFVEPLIVTNREMLS